MAKARDDKAKTAAARAPNTIMKSQLGAMGEALHDSHTMHHRQGIVWCWRCGGYATELSRSLGKPCLEGGMSPSRGGANNLKRLAKGLTPRSDLEWPRGASEGLGEGRVVQG